jgi:hypothetical protein
MVSIIDTTEYGEWVSNFHPQYHPTAELLARSLHYLDETTFRSNLTEQILRDFDSGQIEPPALVVPIRTGPEMGLPRSERAIIFENVFPDSGLPVPNTGSEALCSNIIRNVAKGQGSRMGMIPRARTLNDLRIRRTRSIVLVGDYAGSGSQAIESAKIWTRNRSIRSWRSYRWIKIHVVIHSASVAAKEILERDPSIDRLSMVSIAPDFDSAGWTAEQRKDIEEFCSRFARKQDGEDLGWKGSAGLFVMQHTAPNNLPMVLRQTKGESRREEGWYPLFPAGRVPGNVADALSAQNEQKREQHSGGGAGTDQTLDPFLLSALDAVLQGARTPERISAFADIPLAHSMRLLRELTEGGYVDTRGYVTDEGRRLLTSEAPVISRFRLKGSDAPYYPQALRRVGDI